MKTLPCVLAQLDVDPSKRTYCGLPRSSRTHWKMNTDFVDVEFYSLDKGRIVRVVTRESIHRL